MRILIFITLSILVSACNQNRRAGIIATNGTIHILPESVKNPYTYLRTQGKITVRTIPAITFYAASREQDNWLTLLSEDRKFVHIIGGEDTIGFALDEFYDENNPNGIRSTFIQVNTNGLQPVSQSVLQRSFPFIFGKDIGPGKSDTTIATQSADMERKGNHWTIHIVKTDKENPIAIPIITTPNTVFTIKNVTEDKTDISKVKFVIDAVHKELPKIGIKDTTVVGNAKPLIIQGQSSWNASKPVTLAVFIGAEKVAILTIMLQK